MDLGEIAAILQSERLSLKTYFRTQRWHAVLKPVPASGQEQMHGKGATLGEAILNVFQGFSVSTRGQNPRRGRFDPSQRTDQPWRGWQARDAGYAQKQAEAARAAAENAPIEPEAEVEVPLSQADARLLRYTARRPVGKGFQPELGIRRGSRFPLRSLRFVAPGQSKPAVRTAIGQLRGTRAVEELGTRAEVGELNYWLGRIESGESPIGGRTAAERLAQAIAAEALAEGRAAPMPAAVAAPVEEEEPVAPKHRKREPRRKEPEAEREGIPRAAPQRSASGEPASLPDAPRPAGTTLTFG